MLPPKKNDGEREKGKQYIDDLIRTNLETGGKTEQTQMTTRQK